MKNNLIMDSEKNLKIVVKKFNNIFKKKVRKKLKTLITKKSFKKYQMMIIILKLSCLKKSQLQINRQIIYEEIFLKILINNKINS